MGVAVAAAFAMPVPGANAFRRVPIIWLHGFVDTSRFYDRLARCLLNRRDVVTFDFLGWGRSDKPSGHTYDAAVLLDAWTR